MNALSVERSWAPVQANRGEREQSRFALSGGGRTADALPLIERVMAGGRAQLGVALAVLHDAQQKQLMPAESAFDGALDVIQHGAQSSAASAMNKLAVGIAAGNDHFAELVRRDQDLASEAERLDKAIIAALSRQASPREAANGRGRLAAIADERGSLQKTLAEEFHDYAAPSNPLPLKSRDIQMLSSGDEAMVLFALADKESFVLAPTRDPQLKLNADFVVLSACNTIAGDKPGAEALSGLARAFFYAGARSLLVTHWSVDSEAATRLAASTSRPAQGRAKTRPRGGAATGDAGLSRRFLLGSECLSRALGPICFDWRGSSQ